MVAPRGFSSEVDLGRTVVAWLRGQGWDVYQEPGGPMWSGPDILAVKREPSEGGSGIAMPISPVWAIELKLGIGFDVLAQADRWLRQAHLVSVATAASKQTEGRMMAERVLADLGIGWIVVYPGSGGVKEHVPALHRQADPSRLLRDLRPEMRDYAPAGNPGARRFTPFKGMLADVARVVRERPGMSVKEIVAATGPMHYGTPGIARRQVARALERGWVDGVKAWREEGLLRAWPSQ